MADARDSTCPDELAIYSQCVLDNPLYCFPTCVEIDVSIQPDDLKYLMDPSIPCDLMKLSSCAMRDCCKKCLAEEDIYWSCIERNTGCGAIDCVAILDPIDGDNNSEPQNEETPPKEDVATDIPTVGSDGQASDKTNGGEQPSTNEPSTNDFPTGEPTLSTTTVVEPPLDSDTDSVPNEDTATGDGNTDSTSVDSTASDATCPGELALYSQCVLSHPLKCFPDCANVQVSTNAMDLFYAQDPSLPCHLVTLASCAMQNCCEPCAIEELVYWSCIERDMGCGDIDCNSVLSPLDDDTSSEPQNDETPEQTPPPTAGASDRPTVSPSTECGDIDCNSVSSPTGGDTSSEPQNEETPEETPLPTAGESDQPTLSPTAEESDQPTVSPTTNTADKDEPTVVNDTGSGTNNDNNSGSDNSDSTQMDSYPSNSRGITCPEELDIYSQCVLNNPLYCFPNCVEIDVTIQPDDLTNLMDPSIPCDLMKFSSCAMRNCCKKCLAEEATYWSCIERESGCGEIDCQAVLSTRDGSIPTNSPIASLDADTDTTSGAWEYRIAAWLSVSVSLLAFLSF